MNDSEAKYEKPIIVYIQHQKLKRTIRHSDIGWFDVYGPGSGFWSYLWEEGNFSCDCNRALYFRMALGQTNEYAYKHSHRCGEKRYRIRITDQLGVELYKEAGFNDQELK